MRRVFFLTLLACFSLGMVSAQLVLTMSGQNGTSFCNPNGYAAVSIGGGEPPFYYQWNNGGTEAIIFNLDAGTYEVTVTDGTSTTAAGSISITNTYPLIVDASATNETDVNANDGTAHPSPTGGLSPYTFAWSNGATTFMIINLSPGLYTVTVTDAAGCTAAEGAIVNGFGCPPLSLGANITNPECYGDCDGVIQIHAVGNGEPPFIYSWSTGSSSSTVTNLCAGNFSVTVVDEDGCGVAETYVITTPSEINPGATSSDESGPGANDGSASASPSGGTGPYTFLWNNSSTSSSITGLGPGNYTVTVTDAHSCSATQTVSVAMFGCTLLEGFIVSPSCFGDCNGSITVVLNNPLPPVTFIWQDGTTQSSLTGLCPGIYSVTATDAAGCSASGSFTMTQPFPLNANTSDTNETSPDANDGTAWSSPEGGTAPYTYLWSNGSVDSLIINLSPGIYFLTVTDANGCTDVDIANISGIECIGFHTFQFEEPTCHESCDGSATVIIADTASVFSYLWNTGETTPFLNNLCNGSFSLTITNENLGCTDNTFIFTLHPPAALVLHIDKVTHITDSTSASILIHVTGGTSPFSFLWSGPGGFVGHSEDLAGIVAGTYSVDIVDARGCTLTDTIIIEDNSTVGIPEAKQLRIDVHPNPARDRLFISAATSDLYYVQIINLEGRIIYTARDEKEIDLHDIGAGIYILKVSTLDKYFIDRLVIIR